MPHDSRRAAALVVFLLLLVCSVLPAQATEAPEENARLQLRSGQITVFHHRDDSRPANRILEVAADRAGAVAAAAGLDSLGAVAVFIASTDNEFGALTYGGVPDWGAGCAFPDRRIIVLRNPITAPDPLHMEDVVVHEMAHVAAGQALGGVRVPRWFHEGIAMSVAGEWRLPQSSLLAGAGASGELIPLADLRSSFPGDGAGAMLAYTESFYALRYLMTQSGNATPAELMSAVAHAGDFDAAVQTLTGRDLATFERDAVGSFRRRFGWPVLLTRWNVGFALLALVLIVGGSLRLRRSRIRLREWAEEEAGGPTSRERGIRTRGGRGDRRGSGWS